MAPRTLVPDSSPSSGPASSSSALWSKGMGNGVGRTQFRDPSSSPQKPTGVRRPAASTSATSVGTPPAKRRAFDLGVSPDRPHEISDDTDDGSEGSKPVRSSSVAAVRSDAKRLRHEPPRKDARAAAASSSISSSHAAAPKAWDLNRFRFDASNSATTSSSSTSSQLAKNRRPPPPNADVVSISSRESSVERPRASPNDSITSSSTAGGASKRRKFRSAAEVRRSSRDAERKDDTYEGADTPPTSEDTARGGGSGSREDAGTSGASAPSRGKKDEEASLARIQKLYAHVPRRTIFETYHANKGDVRATLQRLSQLRARPGAEKAGGEGARREARSGGASAAAATSTGGRNPRDDSPPLPALRIPGRFDRARSSTTSATPPTTGAAATTKRAPHSHRRNSDDEEEDGSDGSEGVSDDEARREEEALAWFNACDAEALMDTTGCNEKAAEMLVSLRPYRSVRDVEAKLGDRKNKGVQPRLFHNCAELMAGYHTIDQVLAKCERMGAKLAAEIASWDSAEGPMQPEHYLTEQPKTLSSEFRLKPFQLRGVNWLNLLYRHRCGGILADEMGTGKTFQVIAFLSQLLASSKSSSSSSSSPAPPRTHLIVVPNSVLENWEREFTRFSPDVEVYRYHGSQDERSEMRQELKLRKEEDDRPDVVLTTYEMASGGERDHKFFKKYGFDACIYDEGHILKNKKSQKYEKLKRIRCHWSVLLTGTPLQNNLGELMALLNFIMPTYFSRAQEALDNIFKTTAGRPQNQLSKQRVGRAQKMMQPFVLRRRKTEVLTDLPPKQERVIMCDMPPHQRRLYDQVYARTRDMRQRALEAAAAAASGDGKTGAGAGVAGGGGTKSRTAPPPRHEGGHVLMELRKAANHPLLLRDTFDRARIEALARDYRRDPRNCETPLQHCIEDFEINSDAELSLDVAEQFPTTKKHALPDEAWLQAGKMTALLDVVDEARKRGEKLIIFSQFVQTLRCICKALEIRDVPYRGFTGSDKVTDRQPIVDEFTRDASIPVFLLTRKAGGVGINLTAASQVVLYDQDYNPQNDRQAADRCYRIGQDKPVTITRLVSRGTIEEHILDLARAKLLLASRVEANGGQEAAAATDTPDSNATRATTLDDGGEAIVESEEQVEADMQRALLRKLAEVDGGRDVAAVSA